MAPNSGNKAGAHSFSVKCDDDTYYGLAELQGRFRANTQDVLLRKMVRWIKRELNAKGPDFVPDSD